MILSLLLGLGVAAAAVLLMVERWGDVSPLEAVLSFLIGGAVFFSTYLASWLLFSLVRYLLFRHGKSRGETRSGEDESSQSP